MRPLTSTWLKSIPPWLPDRCPPVYIPASPETAAYRRYPQACAKRWTHTRDVPPARVRIMPPPRVTHAWSCVDHQRSRQGSQRWAASAPSRPGDGPVAGTLFTQVKTAGRGASPSRGIRGKPAGRTGRTPKHPAQTFVLNRQDVLPRRPEAPHLKHLHPICLRGLLRLVLTLGIILAPPHNHR